MGPLTQMKVCQTECVHIIVFWWMDSREVDFTAGGVWRVFVAVLMLFSTTRQVFNLAYRSKESEYLMFFDFESQSHLQFHLQLWSLLPGSWSPWWLCGTLSLCSRNLSAETHRKHDDRWTLSQREEDEHHTADSTTTTILDEVKNKTNVCLIRRPIISTFEMHFVWKMYVHQI